MNSLLKAFEIAGGAAALALKINVSQSAPHMWIARGNVPTDVLPAIEHATDGAISVEQLSRPEVRWLRIKDRAWPWNGGRPVLDVAMEYGATHPRSSLALRWYSSAVARRMRASTAATALRAQSEVV
jgi:DNA-binding transcriptional regulator YdaS (Cro superfamily)